VFWLVHYIINRVAATENDEAEPSRFEIPVDHDDAVFDLAKLAEVIVQDVVRRGLRQSAHEYFPKRQNALRYLLVWLTLS
jgi:hypothetical protein